MITMTVIKKQYKSILGLYSKKEPKIKKTMEVVR